MKPNPLLKKLGLSDDDRAVIFHADDVGMCQASLAAYVDLVDFGLLSAASVMVPCPWFPATAAFCRDHPHQVDMGVHLTLTSEWQGYRWGPISTRDPESGLIDQQGYFYHTSEQAQRNGDPTAVQREIEAQVGRALEAGIDVTHIDTHMGAVAHPKFIPAYVQTALQRRIPPFLVRNIERILQEMSDRDRLAIDASSASFIAQQLLALEEQGVPALDYIEQMPLEQADDRLEQVKQVLASLPAGITYLIIHPAKDTPELRAITESWRGRVADYEAFTSKALKDFVGDSGIHVIGWRVLRDVMRSEFSKGA
jgi:predicted glycoside hydrolase/deacetylase ChbG (UPF0249 family)